MMSIIIPAIARAAKRDKELGVGGSAGAQSICPLGVFLLILLSLAGLALAGYELLRADDYASVMRAAIATYEAERESMAAFYESDSPETFEESYEHTALGEVDQQYYSLGDRIYDIWAIFAHDRPDLFMK